MSSGFKAGEQLSYWQKKANVMEIRARALHTSQLLLLLSQQLSVLVPAAVSHSSHPAASSEAATTADGTAVSAASPPPPTPQEQAADVVAVTETAGSADVAVAVAGADKAAPEESSASRSAAAALRWVPLQQQISKLVSALLEPPSASSSSGSSTASTAVLRGLQRNLNNLAGAMSTRSDADSVTLAISLAARLLPTAAALLLSMQLNDILGERRGKTPKQKAEAYSASPAIGVMQGACALLLDAVARGAVVGGRRHSDASATEVVAAFVPPSVASACVDLGKAKVFTVAVQALNKVLGSLFNGADDARLHLVGVGFV